MIIPEVLLHFIWQYRLFNQFDITTVCGTPVRIIDPGQYNNNAGPDFEFAKVQIGDTLWSGHVEIHTRAKAWRQHKHHLDNRYNSTILHVVWEYDAEAIRRDGTILPTVELRGRVQEAVIVRYANLMNNMAQIPCENQAWGKVSDISLALWRERMLIERLERKGERVKKLLSTGAGHWQSTLITLLGRAFGMQVNAHAFETLTKQLDLTLLLKYRAEPTKLAALLFGVSGLLPSTSEVSDSYTALLNKEFRYLRQLHHLTSMSEVSWKFHRMRPYNFPTFRLAQFAALCAHEMYWFDKIREIENVKDIMHLLKGVQPDSYWQNHFRFGAMTAPHPVRFSDRFIAHLFVNCFAPALFHYGVVLDDESCRHKAISWLLQLPEERNAITKTFERLGWQNENAADSQALLHLKKEYCDRRECLSCAVGHAILKRG
ncbi:DUF2851 family protein [Sphingobacterium sp. SGG-5]|uniref:DUF2851 family protein n=1 Tax=Sphingobacterium sp. SGG-5 TaxID=2710881 RepID=UPI0013EB5F5A|nr:DUF2851 family protein [Sphingobacterium sp. SGG-5]NGM61510.1 DUF2851 family protein [Sphingobacterium sp. SGG-5]